MLDLISPSPGRVLFGVVVTIRFLPYREDLFPNEANSFARCFYAAIGSAPQGKVVIFDSAGYVNTSVGGGTKLSRLHNTEVAGLITDARLRDLRELAEYDPVLRQRSRACRHGGWRGHYTCNSFQRGWAAAIGIETDEMTQRQSIRDENLGDENAESREL